MTITLAREIETRLRRKAARTGEQADALAESLLSEALADEASEGELRAEYQQLVALELKGNISEAASARLRSVTQQLDDRDRDSPAAQTMFQQLNDTGRKLDEMLAILQGMPLREQTP